ncbi:MAG: PhoPQ-activated protein PqaA family protein, partial [FCB group bacterium]|nr:PhoPQ-activated protein PqaA family protein [FCB group bacterium]
MSRTAQRLSLVLLISIFTSVSMWASANALDDYVAAPDANYSWALHATYPHTGYTDYILTMNSQVWSPPGGVNVSLWHHWLIITVPNQVDHETAMFFISGGSIYSSAPTGNDAFLVNMATTTHSVVAQLKTVPNEPLTITGYRQENEDGLITYGWKQFLLGGDPLWLMRLPMTKAAVRGMDTVTAFMATPQGGSRTVNKFVVSGAS